MSWRRDRVHVHKVRISNFRSADEWDLGEEDDVVNSSASRRLILRRIASPSRYRIQSPQPHSQQQQHERHSPRQPARDVEAQDGQESSPPRKVRVIRSFPFENSSNLINHRKFGDFLLPGESIRANFCERLVPVTRLQQRRSGSIR